MENYYYNTTGIGSWSSFSDIDDSRLEMIYRSLHDRGLSDAEILAVMEKMNVESGLDPFDERDTGFGYLDGLGYSPSMFSGEDFESESERQLELIAEGLKLGRIGIDTSLGNLNRTLGSRLGFNLFGEGGGLNYTDDWYGEAASKFNWYPSKSILDYIKKAEGFRSRWYKDGNGIDTIGYGFTDKSLKTLYPRWMSRRDAEQRFREEVDSRVSAFISATPNFENLTSDQKDSLFSYYYNIGHGRYTVGSPKMQEALIAGDLYAVRDNIDAGYSDPRNPGLKKRRDYERSLFNLPDRPSVGIRVPETNIPAYTAPMFDNSLSDWASGQVMSDWAANNTFDDGGYKDRLIRWAVNNEGALWQNTDEAAAARKWLRENSPADLDSLYWVMSDENRKTVDPRFLSDTVKSRIMQDAVRERDKAAPYIAGALAAPVIIPEAIGALPTVGNALGNAAAKTLEVTGRMLTPSTYGKVLAESAVKPIAAVGKALAHPLADAAAISYYTAEGLDQGYKAFKSGDTALGSAYLLGSLGVPVAFDAINGFQGTKAIYNNAIAPIGRKLKYADDLIHAESRYHKAIDAAKRKLDDVISRKISTENALSDIPEGEIFAPIREHLLMGSPDPKTIVTETTKPYRRPAALSKFDGSDYIIETIDVPIKTMGNSTMSGNFTTLGAPTDAKTLVGTFTTHPIPEPVEGTTLSRNFSASRTARDLRPIVSAAGKEGSVSEYIVPRFSRYIGGANVSEYGLRDVPISAGTNEKLSEYISGVSAEIGDLGAIAGSTPMIAKGYFSGVPHDLEVVTTESKYADLVKKLRFSGKRMPGSTVANGTSPTAGGDSDVDIQIISQDDDGNAVGMLAHEIYRTIHPERAAHTYSKNALSGKHFTEAPLPKEDGTFYTPEELLAEYRNVGELNTIVDALSVKKGYADLRKYNRPIAILLNRTRQAKENVRKAIDIIGKSQLQGAYESATDMFPNLSFDNIEANKAFLRRLSIPEEYAEDAEIMENIVNYYNLQQSVSTRMVGGAKDLDEVYQAMHSTYAPKGGTTSGGGGNSIIAGQQFPFLSYPVSGAAQYAPTKYTDNITTPEELYAAYSRLRGRKTLTFDEAKKALSIFSESGAVTVEDVNYIAGRVNTPATAKRISEELDMPFIRGGGYDGEYIGRYSDTPAAFSYRATNTKNISDRAEPFEFGRLLEKYSQPSPGGIDNILDIPNIDTETKMASARVFNSQHAVERSTYNPSDSFIIDIPYTEGMEGMSKAHGTLHDGDSGLMAANFRKYWEDLGFEFKDNRELKAQLADELTKIREEYEKVNREYLGVSGDTAKYRELMKKRNALEDRYGRIIEGLKIAGQVAIPAGAAAFGIPAIRNFAYLNSSFTRNFPTDLKERSQDLWDSRVASLAEWDGKDKKELKKIQKKNGVLEKERQYNRDYRAAYKKYKREVYPEIAESEDELTQAENKEFRASMRESRKKSK